MSLILRQHPTKYDKRLNQLVSQDESKIEEEKILKIIINDF